MGVAVGPFKPTRVTSSDAKTSSGSNWPWSSASAFAPGLHALPFDGCAGGLHRARGGIGHFGANAVAGNQRNLMSHQRYYRGGWKL